jgi:hypothetical protein
VDELPKLGRFEKLPLREVWKREDTVFTPWLAQPENLQLLADAIGLPELELIQTERQVSEFSLDIIARVPSTGEVVAIENQIEISDHRHLGQSIVYAAGTEAKIIVWIVAQFTEGHRAALDWLNRVTSEDLVFFGVEVEAWRIGQSEPAPKLNVVVRPNAWQRRARRQVVASAGSEEGELNAAYWTAFLECAAGKGLALGNKTTRARNVYLYLGGERKIAVVAFLSRYSRKVGTFKREVLDFEIDFTHPKPDTSRLRSSPATERSRNNCPSARSSNSESSEKRFSAIRKSVACSGVRC